MTVDLIGRALAHIEREDWVAEVEQHHPQDRGGIRRAVSSIERYCADPTWQNACSVAEAVVMISDSLGFVRISPGERAPAIPSRVCVYASDIEHLARLTFGHAVRATVSPTDLDSGSIYFSEMERGSNSAERWTELLKRLGD